MPEFGIPVDLETPVGTLSFNQVGSVHRLTAFNLTTGIRSTVEDAPQRDGSYIADAFAKGASVSLSAEIQAPGSSSVRATAASFARRALLSIMRADGTLAWTPTGGEKRRLIVRAYTDPDPSGQVVKSYQLGLVSGRALPESYALASASSGALSPVGASTWQFPFSFPFSFGDAAAGGTVAITNAGNAKSYPLIRIFGPVSAPVVRNQATGKIISLPGLLLDAISYVDIDCYAETILLNGSADYSLIGSLDPTVSDFFCIEPDPTVAGGVNTLQVSGSGYTGSTFATVFYRNGWVD